MRKKGDLNLFIGNDIVALSSTQKPHPRFDSRVFTPSEIKQIETQGDTRRWHIWAAKEACYKLEKQRDPTLFFSPIEYEWFQEENCLKFRNHATKVYFELDSELNYVHAWCFEPDFLEVAVQVKRAFDVPQSLAVRSVAQELICSSVRFKEWAKTLKKTSQETSVLEFKQNSSKVPKAFFCGFEVPVSLSFSHDENYVASAVAWVSAK